MVPETLIQKLKQNAFIKVTIPTLPSLLLQGQITEIGTRAEIVLTCSSLDNVTFVHAIGRITSS
jgi:hypothetical protein